MHLECVKKVTFLSVTKLLAEYLTFLLASNYEFESKIKWVILDDPK